MGKNQVSDKTYIVIAITCILSCIRNKYINKKKKQNKSNAANCGQPNVAAVIAVKFKKK